MLPVLIGAVIGAVAYSMFKDEDSSDKSTAGVEEKETGGTEINLDSKKETGGAKINLDPSVEVLKDLVCSARKVLVQKGKDALARGDLTKYLEIDEKLMLMDEYVFKANQVAAEVMEKFKDEKPLQEEKTEPSSGTALSEDETEGKPRPDIIENVYVSGKTVPADKFVEAIRDVLTERMKKKQEQPDG